MSFKNTAISSLKTLITTILLILANIAAVIFVDHISSDFTVGPLYNALIIVIAVAVINSVIFYIATYFIPGVYVGFYGFWQVPIVMAIASTFITNITNTNYYDSYIKSILKYALKRKSPYKKQYPGAIMLEIDGLSINTLKKAIDNDYMPTLKKWLNEKTHTLKEWETDLSSQTGASQAGILHGNNENIVAYRWVEKENNNKIIVSGKLSHAPEIEKRISDGKGLLINGMSIANMFSGDSKISALTSSKLQSITRIYNKTLHSVFLESYNFQRIFVLFLWDILLEFKSQIMHDIKNIKPS